MLGLPCWVGVDAHVEVPPDLESRKGIVNQPPNTTSKHPRYNQPLTHLRQCPPAPSIPLLQPFLTPHIKTYIYTNQPPHVHPSSWVTLTGKRLNSRKKKLCAKPEKISLPSCRGWAVFQSLNDNQRNLKPWVNQLGMYTYFCWITSWLLDGFNLIWKIQGKIPPQNNLNHHK